MDINVAVIGAGSWGTTVAHLAAHNNDTVVWARSDDLAREITEKHRNSRYLPDYQLHPRLTGTADLDDAVRSADVLVMGVPSHAFRSTAIEVAKSIRAWVPVVSLAKGLEEGTKLRMTQIVTEVVPGHPYGVLTGPNLAKEILAGQAAAAVVAMSDENVARRLQAVFATDLFRVYTNPDVIGSELGGAFKNVIALASGMADGLGAGDNTRAAVITRGLSELTALGVAMGGEPETFSGLAGLGDLLATCISNQSRNRHVGEQLGRGHTIEQVIEEMQQVAEGVRTAQTVLELAEEYGVEMPIAAQVASVCHQGAPAEEAYRGLLRRETASERNELTGR